MQYKSENEMLGRPKLGHNVNVKKQTDANGKKKRGSHGKPKKKPPRKLKRSASWRN